jgi:iron complex outermembrane receptor protein
LGPVTDPQSVSKTIIAFGIGGNPNLQPERSRDFTAGVDFTADVFEGLKIGLNYFDIDYKDRLANPEQNFFTPLIDESVLGPSVVIRNPSVALLNDQVAQATNLFRIGCKTCTINDAGAFIFNYTQNIAESRVRGIDLLSSGSWRVGDSKFTASANFAYMSKDSRRVTPEAAEFELLNTTFNPPHLKGIAGITTTSLGWGAATFVNYTSSYKDTTIDPAGRIASQATLDAQLYAEIGTLMSDRQAFCS